MQIVNVIYLYILGQAKTQKVEDKTGSCFNKVNIALFVYVRNHVII